MNGLRLSAGASPCVRPTDRNGRQVDYNGNYVI